MITIDTTKGHNAKIVAESKRTQLKPLKINIMKNLTKIAKLTTLLFVVSLIVVITIDVITNGAKML